MKRGREDPPPSSSGGFSSTASPPSKKPSNPQTSSPAPPSSSPPTSSNPRPPPSSSSSATQGMPKVQDALGYLDKVKCFARGTLIRLYDGSTLPVEAVTPGLHVMGDDSTPRTVGHLTQGRAPMYRITPALKSQTPFTVNGDHTLVLHMRRSPQVACEPGRRSSRGFTVSWWEVDTDNAARRRVERLSTRAAAETRAAALQDAEAPVWEVSVDDFSRAPVEVQRRCSLVLSAAVTFVNAKEPRLQRVLSAVLGVEVTRQQMEWAAWYLGLWLAGGDAACTRAPKGELNEGGLQSRVSDRTAEYPRLFACVRDSHTALNRLLQAYGLLDRPHVPHSWLCDSLEVRRCILAGAMDGSDSNSAKRPDFTAGCQLLASSLGLSCDVVGGTRLVITGGMENVAQYSVMGLKQRFQGGVKGSGPRRCAFGLHPHGEDDYFGFSVHGGTNLRFLLADFTVTHNSRYSHSPQVYNQFLDIMKDFKSMAIDTDGVIRRVKSLFFGHRSLILGFNQFLPPGYKIEVDGAVKQPPPAGAATAGKGSPSGKEGEGASGPSKAVSSGASQSAPSTGSAPPNPPSYSGPDAGPKTMTAPPPSVPNPSKPTVEFNHAVNYVAKIKHRFREQPQIYSEFLDILHDYQAKRTIEEVYHRVQKLFGNEPDLLAEFRYFLPENPANAARVTGPAAGAGQGGTGAKKPGSGTKSTSVKKATPSTATPANIVSDKDGGSKASRLVQSARDRVQGKGQTARPGSKKGDRGPTPSSGAATVKSKEGKDKSAGSSAPTGAPAAPVVKPQAITYPPGSELELGMMDKLHQVLSRSQWSQFIKALNLFALDVITRVEMVRMIDDLILPPHQRTDAALQELLERWKASIGYDEWEEKQLITSQQSNYYTFVQSVDFTTCPQVTASYRQLPAGLSTPYCSGRTALCEAVLNDSCISIPTGSEDFSFKATRKNVYEEQLFKVEDERFELDMIIENNAAVIRVLEPLVESVQNMSPEQAKALTLNENLDILHLRSISRIYGENGYEMIELLRTCPALTAKIVLERLHQKDEEWRRVRHEMKNVWRKISEANYQRSLDHRSFYFKQEDKKRRIPKSLVAELKEVHAKVFESGVQDETDKDDIFCFPRTDHQVLTSRGFLYYHQVKAWEAEWTAQKRDSDGQLIGPVMIASPRRAFTVDEDGEATLDESDREFFISYEPMAQLVDTAKAASELVAFRSEDDGVDLLLTRNHRVLARLNHSNGEGPWQMWSADDIAACKPGGRGCPPPSVSLMDVGCCGLIDGDDYVGDYDNPYLPFITELQLTKEDRVDAFCELYGYWLVNGSWHADALVFKPLTRTGYPGRSEVDYLLRLLTAVGLYELRPGFLPPGGFRAVPPMQRSKCETAEQFEHRKERGLWQVEVREQLWVRYFGECCAALAKPGGLKRRAHWSVVDEGERCRKAQRADSAVPALSSASADGCQAIPDANCAAVEPIGAKHPIMPWTWHLTGKRLRLLFRGRRRAELGDEVDVGAPDMWRSVVERYRKSGSQSDREQADALEADIAHRGEEAIPYLDVQLMTSSVQSRDDWHRLALNAGFTAHWERLPRKTADTAADAVNADRWEVTYGARRTPELAIGSAVKVERQPVPIPVWCVGVPTEEHLIIVRRVTHEEAGVVISASRPILVGNSGLRPGTEESVMLRQIRQGYVMKPLYTYSMHWQYEDVAIFARMKQLMVRVGREVFKLGDKEVWRLELFCCGFIAQFFDVPAEEAEWKALDAMERELKEREDKGETEVEREDLEVGDEDEDMEPEQDDPVARLRRKRTQTAAASVAAVLAAEKADGMEVESDAGSVAVGPNAATAGGKAQKKKGKKTKPVRNRQRRPAKDELKAEVEEEEEEKEDEVEVDVEGGRADSRGSGKKPTGKAGEEEKDSGADDDDGSSTSNKPRMSPSSHPPSTHSIATITRDILAAHLGLPSPSAVKPMTVALSSFALDQSLHPVRRHSRASHLFFGSNAFYVFFRLHQFLYDRLQTAKTLAYKPRKGSAKKKIPFSGDERWGRFNALLDEFVRGEEKGESKFEDECRNLLGASSYVLFTVDKLVHQLIKQVMALLNSEVSLQLLALYAQELRRAKTAKDAAPTDRDKEEASARLCRQYQYSVSLILANDNLTQTEFFVDKREIGIGLVEGLALSDGQGTLGMKVTAYQESHDADYQAYMEAFMHPVDASQKPPALQRNVERGRASLKGVDVRNGLEVKVCMKTYRLLYVEDSEDVLVRRGRSDRPRRPVDADEERKTGSRAELMNEWTQGRFMELNPDYQESKTDGQVDDDEDMTMRIEGEGGEVGEGGEQEEEAEGVDGDGASEGISVSASPSPAPPTSAGSQGGTALFSAVAAAQHTAEQEGASPAPTPTPSSPVDGDGNGVV